MKKPRIVWQEMVPRSVPMTMNALKLFVPEILPLGICLKVEASDLVGVCVEVFFCSIET